jgi:hypothetical protein
MGKVGLINTVDLKGVWQNKKYQLPRKPNITIGIKSTDISD